MINSTNIIISIGFILFTFSLVNIFTAENIFPSLQRAEILASISSITIISIGFLFKRFEPNKAKRVNLQGKEGLYLLISLNDKVKEELAWGSKLILTATPAATILIYWKDNVLLKRGLITEEIFIPGDVCKNSIKKQSLVSLPNTSNYPAAKEFDSILLNIPSIQVYPLGIHGNIIIGGWTARCFTKSDEIWISGWSEKLYMLLSTLD